MRISIDRTFSLSASLSAFAALVALGARGTTAQAQQSTLGLVAQTGRLATPAGEAALSSWLGIAGRLDGTRWLVDGRASAGTVGDGFAGHDLDGRVRASAPVAGRLGIFVELRGRDASLLGDRTRSFGSDARLAWTGNTGGLFLAADAGRDLPSVPWGRSSYALGLGGWRSFGDVIVAVGVADRRVPGNGRLGVIAPRQYLDSSWNDTLKVWTRFMRTNGPITRGDSGAVNTSVSWREMNVSAQWWRPWLAISARAGVRLASVQGSRAPWGDVEATVPLSSRFAAVAVGGWQPVASLTGDRQGSFLAVGMRLLPRPLHHRALPLGISAPTGALTIAETPGGERIVRVRAPLARAVELSGDFTGWRPIALDAGAGGEWSTRLPIARGTYRVAVRIDGGHWIAPPGTPRVADDFGGESGMIVVK